MGCGPVVGFTQILLPTGLLVRRADSTQAIGNALVAKAGGAGFRSIAARFGRPESTVRRWLRAVREPHAQWLYQRGVDSAILVDREYRLDGRDSLHGHVALPIHPLESEFGSLRSRRKWPSVDTSMRASFRIRANAPTGLTTSGGPADRLASFGGGQMHRTNSDSFADRRRPRTYTQAPWVEVGIINLRADSPMFELSGAEQGSSGRLSTASTCWCTVRPSARDSAVVMLSRVSGSRGMAPLSHRVTYVWV